LIGQIVHAHITNASALLLHGACVPEAVAAR
jgi:hypothetical protein